MQQLTAVAAREQLAQTGQQAQPSGQPRYVKDDARAIMDWILRTNRRVFTETAVREAFRGRFPNKGVIPGLGSEAGEALRWLVSRDWIRPMETHSRSLNGIPLSPVYEANWGKFYGMPREENQELIRIDPRVRDNPVMQSALQLLRETEQQLLEEIGIENAPEAHKVSTDATATVTKPQKIGVSTDATATVTKPHEIDVPEDAAAVATMLGETGGRDDAADTVAMLGETGGRDDAATTGIA